MIRISGVVISIGYHIENALVTSMSIALGINKEIQKFRIYYISRVMIVYGKLQYLLPVYSPLSNEDNERSLLKVRNKTLD